jgi:hypothetical protein
MPVFEIWRCAAVGALVGCLGLGHAQTLWLEPTALKHAPHLVCGADQRFLLGAAALDGDEGCYAIPVPEGLGYAEVALTDIVAAIIATSSGSTPAVALTVYTFTAIGITGIDAINLPLMIAAIEASDDDTSGVNTLAKIQAIANQVISTQNAALAVISQYDGSNTHKS